MTKRDNNRKSFLWIFMVLVLYMCFFAPDYRAKAATTNEIASLKKEIITAFKNYKTVVDTSGYNLYSDNDKSKIKLMMSEVINETPYLFYAGQSYNMSVVRDSGKIVSIELAYAQGYLKTDGSVNTAKIKSTRKKLDKAVDKVIKCVDDKMTDVEKAMVLHDYIIYNTSYSDSKVKNNSSTECGVFLNNKANCQGYSLAYHILLSKVGIKAKFVVSESMGHMWNLIKVGGKWYNVDVTWDDPVDANAKNDQYGLVMHEYFLCSTYDFKKRDHYGFWAKSASSKKYDNKYWKKISSSFWRYKNKWIYISPDGIMQRNNLSSGKAVILKKIRGMSMVELKQGKYYFVAYNSVYLYNRKTNSIREIWRTDSKYKNGYYLTQIKYGDGCIKYRVLKGKKHKNGSFKVNRKGLAIKG